MQVVSGLLKYWPYGSSTKQTMFLNQLEDLFEYVQVRQHAGVLVVASKVHPPSTAMCAVVDGMPEVGCCWCCCTLRMDVEVLGCWAHASPPRALSLQLDDVEVFRDQLVLRLGKAIGGLHFQVAERALCLWNW